MGYVCKLVKGSKSLDLSTGRYALMDFMPPSAGETPYFAGGTSANRFGGAAYVDKRGVNGSLGFSVRILGASNAECERGYRDIASFLILAGDENEPLYLEYRPDTNVGYEPLWGQSGANKRLQVEYGTVMKSSPYNVANTRERAIIANVDLVTRPYAFGKRQRVGAALGGLVEDIIGAAADGNSRGLIISKGTTNLFNNPVFEHATWNNNWNAGASLIASKNIDGAFIPAGGRVSAKLQSFGATNNTFTQTLTTLASTYTISCYVMLPDGGVPDSNDMQLYTDAAITTAFTAEGNGVYRASGPNAFSAAGHACGVVVKSERVVYVWGFQLENKGYTTALATGDMLGCAWTSTAHASTSTRTAARWKVPVAADTYDISQGTIYVALRMKWANSFPSDFVIWDSRDASHTSATYTLSYVASTDKFQFTDGTNTCLSAAQTYDVNTVIVLHATFSPSGTALYINGAVSDTDPSNPTTPGADIFLGCDYNAASQTPAVVLDYEFYNRAMSATEIANHYTNVYQVFADGQGMGSLPYLWTKDGDNILDNGDSGALQNWCVIGSVAGTAPAAVLARATVNGAAGVVSSVYWSLLDMPLDNYQDPGFLVDYGAPDTVSVATSSTQIGAVTLSQAQYKIIGGREIMGIANIDTATSTNNLNLQTAVYVGAAYTADYVYRSYSTTASEESLGVSLPLAVVPYNHAAFGAGLVSGGYQLRLNVKRSSGGAANITVYYVHFVPRPFVEITTTTSFGTDPADILYNDGKVDKVDASSGALYNPMQVIGDRIAPLPRRYNILTSFMTMLEEDCPDSSILTFQSFYLTPRWTVI